MAPKWKKPGAAFVFNYWIKGMRKEQSDDSNEKLKIGSCEELNMDLDKELDCENKDDGKPAEAKKDGAKKDGAIKRTIRDLAILFIVGFIYYLIQKFTGRGMVCFVRYLFHVYCPTCGTTRMIMAMTRLDFKTAFSYNQYMFVTFPFWVGEIIYFFYILESKKRVNKVNEICVFVWIGQ